MKLKITLLLVAISTFLNAQTTAIPDANFEQALIDQGFDTNGLNGNILNSDVVGVIDLIVQNKGITSLNGISAFVDLVNLNARDNMLVSANLTSLQNLETVSMQSNLLSSINLPNNGLVWLLYLSDNRLTSFNANGLAGLELLWISDGQVGYELTSVNVQNNPALSQLAIENNKVTSLDLSNNVVLNTFNARNNDLQSVNMANGNNLAISSARMQENPDLNCKQVDNVAYANANAAWLKDATASYCSTLGINEDNSILDFKLYPNPVSNFLHLETSTKITGLQLTNINGQVVYITNTALNQIDLSDFSTGLYFLKIETEKGVVTRKVVKQ